MNQRPRYDFVVTIAVLFGLGLVAIWAAFVVFTVFYLLAGQLR